MVGLGSTSQEEKAELCLNPALKDPYREDSLLIHSHKSSKNPLQIHTLDVPKQNPRSTFTQGLQEPPWKGAGPGQK